MTEKVQKIRAFLAGIADADGVSTILAKAIEKKILPYIDSLQEEPVGEDLEEAIDAYLATYFGSEKEKQEWPFLKKMAIHFAEWQKQKDSIPVSDDLEKRTSKIILEGTNFNKSWFAHPELAFIAGAQWQREQINEALLSEVLPCFMHGGEADEVVAKLYEVLKQMK